ncbi:hypothetical protein FAI41_04310 [Acetobacteraceae bacterium]|nr:hypothetical protein FAI41_04310 [Acetobacteraceae bacterium]
MAGVSANQTPAEQEHVFGAYADPKALKNRQNEIIQNGGVKAGFGKAEEAPKIPARHSTQEMEQHYAAPENSAQQSGQKMEGEIPSANISQTENTQRKLYLSESAPSLPPKGNNPASENSTTNNLESHFSKENHLGKENENYVIDEEKIMKSATAIDPADKGKKRTVAGRSYTKHAGRKGSSISKPKGSPEQINQLAHNHINTLLNDPEKRIEKHSTRNGRYGQTYMIHSSHPNIDGIRVSPENEFIHFINPE